MQEGKGVKTHQGQHPMTCRHVCSAIRKTLQQGGLQGLSYCCGVAAGRLSPLSTLCGRQPFLSTICVEHNLGHPFYMRPRNAQARVGGAVLEGRCARLTSAAFQEGQTTHPTYFLVFWLRNKWGSLQVLCCLCCVRGCLSRSRPSSSLVGRGEKADTVSSSTRNGLQGV